MARSSGGGLHKYTVQEAQNVQVGQVGSTYSDGTSITGINDGVVVAITMLADTTFTTLTPDSTSFFGSAAGASTVETQDTGSADTTSGVTFPAGMTIYGRWTVIDLASGSCIAYMG